MYPVLRLADGALFVCSRLLVAPITDIFTGCRLHVAPITGIFTGSRLHQSQAFSFAAYFMFHQSQAFLLAADSFFNQSQAFSLADCPVQVSMAFSGWLCEGRAAQAKCQHDTRPMCCYRTTRPETEVDGYECLMLVIAVTGGRRRVSRQFLSINK